jgi:ATP-dependent Lon protease
MIVKKMVEAGNARCIMYFDELDKACKRYDGNEIYNILIHITDPNTNTEFQDRFFQELNFPLNKVLFIFSYNDSSLIDSILMDRIKEIDVKPFKLQDKKVIVNKFLLKEMSELVGFDYGSVKIDDESIELILNQYTNEPGVRELKRKLEKIFLKLNMDRIYDIGIFENVNNLSVNHPITLNKKTIEHYLGKNTIHIQYIHNDNLVGVINGLYATDSGQGGILPIQVFDNYTNGDEKFTLKLTGSQRRVMRESVISAFTTATHCIREDIRDEYIKTHPCGFHIHTPSSAVPKDGPSAGCAFATAFISRILNKKIRNDVAITGEIELTGKVTKIGGLQYKLPGAKRAGIKLVLVSSENSDDIDNLKKEYPDLFDDNFSVKLVANLREVLEHILINFDKSQII